MVPETGLGDPPMLNLWVILIIVLRSEDTQLDPHTRQLAVGLSCAGIPSPRHLWVHTLAANPL